MGCKPSRAGSGAARWHQANEEKDIDPSLHGQIKFAMTLEVGDKIREGSLGEVYELVMKSNRHAVKLIDTQRPPFWWEDGIYGNVLSDRSASPGLQAAEHEVEVWRRVSGHPNVVTLFDAFPSGVFFHLVIELCGMSLYDRLSRKLNAKEANLDNVFRGMLLGVERLHIMDIVHRDVNPRNFLLGGADGWTLKICDFGLSAQLPSKLCKLTFCCGTPNFMSPEMLSGEGYGCATDMWSLGVSAYWMLYGDFPYETHESMLKGDSEPSFLYACDIKQEVGLQRPLELTDVHPEGGWRHIRSHTEGASRGKLEIATSTPAERKLVVDQNVDRIGLRFAGLPPDQVMVKEVVPNTWAEEQDIKPRDVLQMVNNLNVQLLTPDQWLNLMKKRPLVMLLSRGTAANSGQGTGGNLPDGAVEEFARALLDRSPSTRCTATRALLSPCLKTSETIPLAPIFRTERNAEPSTKLSLTNKEDVKENDWEKTSTGGTDFALHFLGRGDTASRTCTPPRGDTLGTSCDTGSEVTTPRICAQVEDSHSASGLHPPSPHSRQQQLLKARSGVKALRYPGPRLAPACPESFNVAAVSSIDASVPVPGGSAALPPGR